MPQRGPLFIIQSPGIGEAIRGIQERVDDKTRRARRLIGSHSVQTLWNATPVRGSREGMRVDTGLMRKEYRFKVAQGNNRIIIFNRAVSKKGFRYPQLIEHRYKSVQRTLERRQTLIASKVRTDLRRPPRSGRLPGELGPTASSQARARRRR